MARKTRTVSAARSASHRVFTTTAAPSTSTPHPPTTAALSTAVPTSMPVSSSPEVTVTPQPKPTTASPLGPTTANPTLEPTTVTPLATAGPPASTPRPTLEPTMPPQRAVIPTVVGTVALELDVVSVRRRRGELQAALARVTSVEVSAVVILSILPGSTVVRFQIATQRPADELHASLKAALSSSSSSPFAPFFPIADSLTLRSGSSRALFAIGVAFYVLVGLGAATLSGLGAWFVYRKRNPERTVKHVPVAAVSGGMIRVQVLDEAAALANGVGDGEPDLIVFGPRGPLTDEDIVRIPARTALGDGKPAASKMVAHDRVLQPLSAADVDPRDRCVSLPMRSSRRDRSRSRRPNTSASHSQEHPLGDIAADDAERLEFNESPEAKGAATHAHTHVAVSVPTNPFSPVPGRFHDRFQRLQPSREVVDGNLEASYAMK